MIKVGIDKICFYSPGYYIDLKTLAEARGIDYNKYYIGLGQREMAMTPPDEDIVTMAANAAEQALKGIDKTTIDTLLFATETCIDQSKSAGVFVHDLLKLPNYCRVVELKQACYSATAALQLALNKLIVEPNKKILLIASDISRYGLNTPGESSQGAAAVAMLLSTNPRILAIEPGSGLHTQDIMDFWRPNYLDEAIVEGKYSSKMYLQALEKTWAHYQSITKREFSDHDYFCYHNSVPRLVEKAHAALAKQNKIDLSAELLDQQIQHGLIYGRKTGNSYTAALYISLASLLDNSKTNLDDQRIGFYSYGSGCVAEFFSGIIQTGYKYLIDKPYHQLLFKDREVLDINEYEKLYDFTYPQDGRQLSIPRYTQGRFRLSEINKHKRIYEKVQTPSVAIVNYDEPSHQIVTG